MADVSDVKKALETKKAVLGADESLKLLRTGKAKRVFVASNCESQLKEDIARMCTMGKVECIALSQTGEELGVMCKKPFAISVIGEAA